MKRLLALPLVFLFVGCGGTPDGEPTTADLEEHMTDESYDALYGECDYATSTIHNRDDLLSCEVALEPCTLEEKFALTFKWTCLAGETPSEGECPVDDTGERTDFVINTSPECQEAAIALVPEDNSWAFLMDLGRYIKAAITRVVDDVSWMTSEGKLPSSNWCGPGDKTGNGDRADDNCRGNESVEHEDCRGDILNGVDGACRRHDHGNNYNEGGENFSICLPFTDYCTPGLPKAQCGVDRAIVRGSHAQYHAGSGSGTTEMAIDTVFGQNSIYKCRAQNQEVCHGRMEWRSCGSWCPGYPWYNSCYRKTYEARNVGGEDKVNSWANQQETYLDSCSGDDSLNDNEACLD